MLVLTSVLLLGCSAKPYAQRHTGPDSGLDATPVYIVNHGWHTGIVVPYAALQAALPELSNSFSGAAYLELGWGDQQFYQADEVTVGMTLRAAILPSPSVMHVAEVRTAFAATERVPLCLSDSEFSSLIDFLVGSFATNEAGQLMPMGPGLYGRSRFYQGVGDYQLSNNCNHWTAKGLQSMGMPLTVGSKFTASSIMDYLNSPEDLLDPWHCDGADD